jgi:hypothetical protein
MPPVDAFRPSHVFLLSPAHCGGERAGFLFRPGASFELALQLRTPRGAPIGEVFSFLSGLYFRGKVAYAARFGASMPAQSRVCGPHVITTNRGLTSTEMHITLDELRQMGSVPIDADDPRYRRPLERSARRLARRLPGDARVVLLGSIASGKYVDVLLPIFGARLFFPAEFIGRGDMSRGGLMLRCADEQRELTYIPVDGARRRGARPEKLAPRVEIIR